MVHAERVRRGHHTLIGFVRASGISKTTLDSIEAARATSYAQGTLAALEDALGWRPGSIERVLSGLSPLVDEDPELTAITELWSRLSPGSRRMLAALADIAARAPNEF